MPWSTIILVITTLHALPGCGSSISHKFNNLSPETNIKPAVEQYAAELAQGCPGGSISVRHQGILININSGWQNLEERLAVTGQTQFPVGSVTKPMTAYAVHHLVKNSHIRLDTPINEILDVIPELWSSITIFHLLTHTSGLKNYNDLGTLTAREIRHGWTLAKAIKKIVQQGQFADPGKVFRYSNSNYVLLGAIIEKVSGKPFKEYLEAHVFKPAGMRATFYPRKIDLTNPRIAQGYEHSADRFKQAIDYHPSIAFAAGAVVSTSQDLVRFMETLIVPQIGRAREFFGRAKLNSSQGEVIETDYIAGGFLDRKFHGRQKISHGGQIWGFNAQLAHYPSEKLTIAITCNNMNPSPNLVNIERKLAKKILQIETQLPEPHPIPSRLIGQYVLKPFHFFDFDQASAVIANNNLNLTLESSTDPRRKWRLNFESISKNKLQNTEDSEITLSTGPGSRGLILELLAGHLRLTKVDKKLCRDIETIVDEKFNEGTFRNASIVVSTSNREPFHCRSARGQALEYVPMTPSFGFRAASTGKMFTAATILKLIEQNKFGLNDKIVDLIDLPVGNFDDIHLIGGKKSHQNGRKIQVKHLLNHASGLADFIFEDSKFIETVLSEPEISGPFGRWNPIRILQMYFDLKLNHKAKFKPGTGFHYSDTNYLLLALLIEEVTGLAFHHAVRQIIFEPLNMHHTYLEWYEQKPKDLRLSQSFFGKKNASKIDTSFDWGGGGFVTTHADLKIFMEALFNGTLFQNPDALSEMKDSWATENSQYGYGLSSLKGDPLDFYGHSGSWGSTVIYNPDNKIFISLTLNQAEDPGTGMFLQSIVKQIIQSGVFLR